MKLIVLLSLVLTSAAFAQTKNARSNDVAYKYELESDGDLFRYIRGSNQRCQVTNNVSSYKISRHKNDAAVIYYVRYGDLYYLKNTDNGYGSCPKAVKKVLMENVKKYTVVSNTNTKIVNIALNHSGKLVAWGNTTKEFEAYRVNKYVNNTCYGSNGKSFKSYVAFAITYGGQVIKIKGQSSRSSKTTQETYYSVQDFKKKQNVCK